MVTNPAGIVEYNGKKLDIALGFFLPWIEYKNQANPKETSNKDSATDPLFVIQPLLGYIQKSKDSGFAYGLGFSA